MRKIATLSAVFFAFLSSIATADSPLYFVSPHSVWKFFATKDPVPQNWNQAHFDDSDWKSGPAGFGYGDDDDKTTVKMQGIFPSVFIRTTFRIPDVTNAERLATIYLYVKYDDGFVAYLNGKQVAIAHVERKNGQLRADSHEAQEYEEFAIENANDFLRVGDNVLALEGHNQALDSSDFSLDPFLVDRQIIKPPQRMAASDLLADLDEFLVRLEDQSSYRTLRNFDYRSAIESLRSSITDETDPAEFALSIRKIVMQLGDCHANVDSPSGFPLPGSIPLGFADTHHGIAAMSLYSNACLDQECPYLEAIDGIPIDRILEVAQRFVQQGSPQLIRQASLGWLGRIELLRREMGVASSPKVIITLRSADGTLHRHQTLRVTSQPSRVLSVGLKTSRQLPGKVGYIRIPLMDNSLIDATVNKIVEFRDCTGLILDVRNNSGGKYELLNEIFGFFVPENAEPHVTNIAAYRLSRQFAKDHIYYRPTYPATWPGWSPAERKAIESLAKNFHPKWEAPKGTMSEWHYMVLSRARGKQKYYHFDQPVIVLCNANSFSATDGFLNAFTELPQVTLMGQSSGGGSGSTRSFKLSKTKIVVSLSSMASYRPNGTTFDGHGIEVDVEALPILADYIGDTDSVIAQAQARLTGKAK